MLLGSISILGCKLRNSSSYDVYSPSSGSLLAIQVADEAKFKASDVKEELSKFSIPENDKSVSFPFMYICSVYTFSYSLT